MHRRQIILAFNCCLLGWSTLTMPAFAEIRAAQMVDLAPNHWAYTAIQILMERYRIMSGFPDKTFRGNKAVSRYELAAALAQIMDRVASRGEEKVSASDRNLVEKLRLEFQKELESVQQLKDQTADLAKQQAGLAKDVKELQDWKNAFQLAGNPASTT
ncbi:MAG: S-layer homology domain-containing protein [Cyanobacteria bacterium NC_groundwater_1444_Ag_S-0.65um_54_12]|nr:S-layer homology domain-containing protein [Cyanobacteria bacterium NC_groundwater_1444_Ag_S-0.65um_54_12]